MTAQRSARDRRRVSNDRLTHPSRPRPRLRWFVVAAIVVAGVGTYWNSLDAPFVWDDDTAIVTNRTIRQLWPPWDALAPPRETPMAGRPVVNLSLAINYAIDGLDVTVYRAWNVAVHVACGLLLFAIVRMTLAGPGLRARFGASAESTALAAALVWMLHPLQSEAVDYVTQRTESMMGFFFLLAMYCVIRGRRSADSGRWEGAAIASCALGAACKESMVIAPLVVLLYDRTFEFGSVRRALQARRRLYVGLALTWVEVGVLMWRWPRSTVGFATAVDPWTYLLNQIRMIVQYLRLSVWPGALVLDYGIPQPVSIRDVIPDALIVVPLLLAAAVALFRWPFAGFLGAAFFLTLAPTSSIIPIDSEVGAERRMYLPMMALSVLVVATLRQLLDRVAARAGRSSRAVVVGATASCIAVVAALGVRTMLRNQEYADRVALWHSVVDRRPHGRARFSYASALIAAGDHERALAELHEAVRDYEDARYALGVELFFAGKVEDAIRELGEFIDRGPSDPNRIPARTLLARALASRGELDGAADQFRAVLERVPSNVEARAELAGILLSQGQFNEAAGEYRTVADQIRSPTAEINLGIALMEGGRLEEATERLERAVQLFPDSAAAHSSLAQVHLRQDRPERAVFHAREAVRLDPGSAVGHNLLGAALASEGRLDEAIGHFRQALQTAPNDEQARANLARALSLAPSRPPGGAIQRQ